MHEEPERPDHLERALDYAYVRDSALRGTRNVFVRLVPPGTATPSNTFSVDHCDVDVDVDEHGHVIGITMIWEESPPPILDPDDETVPNEPLQRASVRARQILTGLRFGQDAELPPPADVDASIVRARDEADGPGPAQP